MSDTITGKTERKPWAEQGKSATKRIRGRKGQSLRNRRMLADNHMCRRCRERGILRRADVIDHIKPLAHGGTDTDDNCRALCNDCHETAGAEQFGRKPKVRISVDGWPEES